MTGWELQLITPSHPDMDASFLTQLESATRENEALQIELRTCLQNKPVPVGDLFTIKQRDDERIVLRGCSHFLHRLGYGWTHRSLSIEGNVGVGLGTHMRGGHIELHGDALSEVGCQMRGGQIEITGSVGDYLGGPLPGYRSGMSGGRVVVRGDAGHHLGHRMRRGTLVVTGRCGDAPASDMVAGTIVVAGTVGDYVAAGMKRGTLILGQPAVLDTARFSSSRIQNLSVMRLLANDLQHDAPEVAGALAGSVYRSLGDRTAGGQGEIWQTSLVTASS